MQQFLAKATSPASCSLSVAVSPSIFVFLLPLQDSNTIVHKVDRHRLVLRLPVVSHRPSSCLQKTEATHRLDPTKSSLRHFPMTAVKEFYGKALSTTRATISCPRSL